jgi:hypothetical protein
MKDSFKGRTAIVLGKARNTIAIEYENSKGHLISKRVNVGRSRVLRNVGRQQFVITPVLDRHDVVGYAVDAIINLPNAAKFLKKPSRSEVIGRVPSRRAPTTNREIYNANMLPDGMYVCDGCKILVSPKHKCTKLTKV